MKAVRLHRLGGPEVLTVDQIDEPEPGPTEVLVQVHAAGSTRWTARRGQVAVSHA